MKETQFISLFDYLGKAAGSELGREVAYAASLENIPYTIKEVRNTVY